MTTREPFLCGPDGALTHDDLTLIDRAAVDNFAAFLQGDVFVCLVCLEPDDQCAPDRRCCPECPGVHVTPTHRRTMDGRPR